MDITKASLRDLYDLGRQGGRIRFEVSQGVQTLYISPKRSRNPLNREVEHLTGLTIAKRQAVLHAVKKVCTRNHMDFGKVMRNTGLSKKNRKRVLAGKCDLKAEHLNVALSKFVEVQDHWFEIFETCGKGAYGTVSTASNGQEWLALKRANPRDEENLSAPDSTNTLLDETRIHMEAGQVPPGQESSVVRTFGIANGADGTPYQALELAIADAEKLVEQQRLAKPGPDADLASKQDFLEKSARTPTLIVTMKDWLGGVSQTASKGIAHRDIKPANFLLTPEGRWKLTDYGTAGDINDEFTLGKDTGNDNYFAKSPEWLISQQDRDSTYRVGPQDDVFSFGAAAYGLLTGGLPPFDFDGTSGPKAYMETVRVYAQRGISFSEWHEQQTGLAIPKSWQPLLNGALHSDPQQRMTADQLRASKLFRLLPVDVRKARKDLLDSFLASAPDA